MRLVYRAALAFLIALIVLGVAEELWLAPLRPHGSLLALKVLPLVIALPGVARARIYTMQWTSMLVLLYFAEGIVNATSGHGRSAACGATEVVLATGYFVCVLAYLHPFKREARLAREAAGEGHS